MLESKHGRQLGDGNDGGAGIPGGELRLKRTNLHGAPKKAHRAIVHSFA